MLNEVMFDHSSSDAKRSFGKLLKSCLHNIAKIEEKYLSASIFFDEGGRFYKSSIIRFLANAAMPTKQNLKKITDWLELVKFALN